MEGCGFGISGWCDLPVPQPAEHEQGHRMCPALKECEHVGRWARQSRVHRGHGHLDTTSLHPLPFLMKLLSCDLESTTLSFQRMLVTEHNDLAVSPFLVLSADDLSATSSGLFARAQCR
jgi:hypothetical protein